MDLGIDNDHGNDDHGNDDHGNDDHDNVDGDYDKDVNNVFENNNNVQ